MVTVTGEQFKTLLEREDMTDSNAAKIMGVTSKTIREWCEAGPTGTAAVMIAFLIDAGVPLGHVADRLHVRLSPFRRHQYRRIAGRP